MNSTHPIRKNFMMQATPAGPREVQVGIQATLWGVGWVVGPLAAGFVLDASGDDYKLLMLTTVGIYLIAAFLNWILLTPVEASLGACKQQEAALPGAEEAEVAARISHG